MASTGSVRKHLQENPSNFDPRKFLEEATNAMKGICQARYEAFNSAGQASKINKIYSLDEMSQKYVAGELDQKIS
jgi:fructose-bisphosphate aldolase class II